MCQAVQDHSLGTGELVALDTWEGDPHAGYYDDDVFESFERCGSAQYPTRACAAAFDEALSKVAGRQRRPSPHGPVPHVRGREPRLRHVAAEARRPEHRPVPRRRPRQWLRVVPVSGRAASERGGFSFFDSFGLGVLDDRPCARRASGLTNVRPDRSVLPCAGRSGPRRRCAPRTTASSWRSAKLLVERQDHAIADRDRTPCKPSWSTPSRR